MSGLRGNWDRNTKPGYCLSEIPVTVPKRARKDAFFSLSNLSFAGTVWPIVDKILKPRSWIFFLYLTFPPGGNGHWLLCMTVMQKARQPIFRVGPYEKTLPIAALYQFINAARKKYRNFWDNAYSFYPAAEILNSLPALYGWYFTRRVGRDLEPRIYSYTCSTLC